MLASYPLDMAAVIMPAIASPRSTTLFRISADFREPIDPRLLQEALDLTLARFPYFAVSLKRGPFWYGLVPLEERVLVEADPESPCQGFDPNTRGRALFRIRFRGNRLAGEFSHLLGDGRGALRLMKTLLAEYCRLMGKGACEPHPDIYPLDSPVRPEEYEDAYVRHCRPGLPAPVQGRKAFRLPGSLLSLGDYRVTTARIPLEAALAVARALGASLTELVGAAYLAALQEIYLSTPERGRRGRTELAVEIPVDMRRYYPTETNRNFTLYTILGEDMRLGPRSFEDILARLKYRFRLENDEASIARHISRNVAAMQSPFLACLPLGLKDLGARLVFAVLGEDYVSGVVTNLGPVDLPASLAEEVLRFDLIQPPSEATRLNIAMHSYAGELYVTLGSLAEATTMEDLILARLVSLGLKAEVDCNLEA